MLLRSICHQLSNQADKFDLLAIILLFSRHLAHPNFSGHNKIWLEQEIGEHCPRMPPMATGLAYSSEAFSKPRSFNCCLLFRSSERFLV